MIKTRISVIALFLSVLAITVFLYKVFYLHFPLEPNSKSTAYTVEARMFFSARKNQTVKARLMIPKTSNDFIIINENFISKGYGLSTSKKSGNRKATWSVREAKGDQYLFYRATVQKVKDAEFEGVASKPSVKESDYTGAQLVAAESLLKEINRKSADLETFMSELVKALNSTLSIGEVSALLGGRRTLARKAETAVEILALNGTPARIVHGLALTDESRDSKLIHWLEVFEDRYWHPFTLEPFGTELPSNYFPWWKGEVSLYYLKGGENPHTSFAVRRNDEGAISAALMEGKVKSPLLLEFSLLNLPIDVQSVYRILFLIPLGALIVIIFRNVIGLQSFGTFMPILIAISFRETHLLWGIFFLVLLVSIGLLARFALERLKLLLIPRLSAVLTIVILLMAAVSIVSHKLGFERTMSVALFPIIIIAMIIERMSIVWEEQGAGNAVKQGLGSLLIATVIFAVLTMEQISHIVFLFPEVQLIILSVILLLGRYTGYRLLELRRFKAFCRKAL